MLASTRSPRARWAPSCTPRIAGSELVTLHATGHCPQLSAPEATGAAIAAFAARVGRLMCAADHGCEPGLGDEANGERVAFYALLEDSAEDLYEHAPCGYLSTLLDGQIAKINTTLLDWLGYRAASWSAGGGSPTCSPSAAALPRDPFRAAAAHAGRGRGIALELVAADGRRLPVLVTSVSRPATTGSRC